jgi:hypothetical protein
MSAKDLSDLTEAEDWGRDRSVPHWRRCNGPELAIEEPIKLLAGPDLQASRNVDSHLAPRIPGTAIHLVSLEDETADEIP